MGENEVDALTVEHNEGASEEGQPPSVRRRRTKNGSRENGVFTDIPGLTCH